MNSPRPHVNGRPTLFGFDTNQITSKKMTQTAYKRFLKELPVVKYKHKSAYCIVPFTKQVIVHNKNEQEYIISSNIITTYLLKNDLSNIKNDVFIKLGYMNMIKKLG